MKRLPLLLVTVVLVPLATAVHAQSDDKAYCAQLVDLYRAMFPGPRFRR